MDKLERGLKSCLLLRVLLIKGLKLEHDNHVGDDSAC